ncbi:MAG TPA: hypothetical protein VG497_21955 [Kribbella sp.]|nr:hypothetical protein [Kribbella sp.]
MGLDAFVPCRCWEDGRTTEPPVPRSSIVRVDGMLDLTLPYDGHEQRWGEFDAWIHNGCGHRDMEYAAAHIGNWPEYRQLQWALGAAGWDRFPMLQRILPEGNGGKATPEEAAVALNELGTFLSAGPIGARTEVYDGMTGEPIATENPAYGYRFVIGPEYAVGVDANGIFVVSTPADEELFRARRVRQRTDGDRAWLSDLDRPGQAEILVPGVIGGGASLLLTRSRSYNAADFAGTVEALRTVFNASVEIRTSVFWS